MTNSSGSQQKLSSVVSANSEDLDVCGGPNVVGVRCGPKSISCHSYQSYVWGSRRAKRCHKHSTCYLRARQDKTIHHLQRSEHLDSNSDIPVSFISDYTRHSLHSRTFGLNIYCGRYTVLLMLMKILVHTHWQNSLTWTRSKALDLNLSAKVWKVNICN